ncbi:MAG: gamma-glutamyl-gamma-aminobutyrate hydrolase family protein, partial [bacterium]
VTIPIIGITTYGRGKNGRFSLPAEYLDSVRQAGGLPIALTPGETRIDRLPNLIDGLIFAGGEDIDPAKYNGNASHPSVTGVDAERDSFELALAEHILATSLPTLGICRGSQLLTLATGGTLIEHMPDEFGNAIVHRGADGEEVDHQVQIQPKSRLAQIVGTTNLTVKSKHHQGMRTIPDAWEIAAHAPDGSVEALEHRSHPWMIAVLWHPEMSPRDNNNQNIFKALIEASRRSKYAFTK